MTSPSDSGLALPGALFLLQAQLRADVTSFSDSSLALPGALFLLEAQLRADVTSPSDGGLALPDALFLLEAQLRADVTDLIQCLLSRDAARAQSERCNNEDGKASLGLIRKPLRGCGRTFVTAVLGYC